MKSAIIALTALFLLSSCAGESSNALTAPDVVAYSRDVQARAADEIEGGQCPVLGDIMMPDYKVMRDQSRVLRGTY